MARFNMNAISEPINVLAVVLKKLDKYIVDFLDEYYDDYSIETGCTSQLKPFYYNRFIPLLSKPNQDVKHFGLMLKQLIEWVSCAVGEATGDYYFYFEDAAGTGSLKLVNELLSQHGAPTLHV